MALADAGVPYDDVGQAYAAYCYGDSTYGQRCLYQLGMTGIPVVNVHNNCSTGSSALFLARQAVMSGVVDCALALGFEKMEKGSLGMKYTDRTPAMDLHVGAMMAGRGDWEAAPPAPQMFGNAGREHMERYGSTPEHYAWIGYKNHKHSVNNPYAQFQTEYTLDEIKDSREIFSPLTKLQCSPTSDGAGCAIVASERYVDEHDLWDGAVEIAGQAMATDFRSTFDEQSSIKVCGFDLSKAAASGRAQPGRGGHLRRRRHRAARLLLRQRADHLRGARPRSRGRGPQARRGRGDHLRRRRPGRQPVRRADLQGPPARRHRPRPVRRAHLAAARQGGQAAGGRREASRSSTTSASAARPSSPSTKGGSADGIATDELKDYRESYATFLQREVVPNYPDWHEAQIVPRALFTQCAEYGFLAMEIPDEYGGPGVDDWRFNCVLAEESVKAGVGDAMAGPLLHSDVVLPYIMQSATRRAEGALAARHRVRRVDPRHRDDRARHRLGPRRHRSQGPAARATATSSTAPRPSSPTASTPTRWWSRPARPTTSTAACRCSSSTAAWTASSAASRSRRSASTPPTPRSCSSRTSSSPRRTGSARRARASCSSSAASSPSG